MTVHISTKQVVEHIKTADFISVDGIIYKKFTITETDLVVDGGKYTFPFAYFDIGGMDHNSLALVDTSHEYRRVQMHDVDNVTIDHPVWADMETYDNKRVKNWEIQAIANQTPFDK